MLYQAGSKLGGVQLCCSALLCTVASDVLYSSSMLQLLAGDNGSLSFCVWATAQGVPGCAACLLKHPKWCV
jgi:hypothetical protein